MDQCIWIKIYQEEKEEIENDYVRKETKDELLIEEQLQSLHDGKLLLSDLLQFTQDATILRINNHDATVTLRNTEKHCDCLLCGNFCVFAKLMNHVENECFFLSISVLIHQPFFVACKEG